MAHVSACSGTRETCRARADRPRRGEGEDAGLYGNVSVKIISRYFPDSADGLDVPDRDEAGRE